MSLYSLIGRVPLNHEVGCQVSTVCSTQCLHHEELVNEGFTGWSTRLLYITHEVRSNVGLALQPVFRFRTNSRTQHRLITEHANNQHLFGD